MFIVMRAARSNAKIARILIIAASATNRSAKIVTKMNMGIAIVTKPFAKVVLKFAIVKAATCQNM